MRSEDVPVVENYGCDLIPIQHLLEIVISKGRADWSMLPKEPGIYIVFLPQGISPQFKSTTGKAVSCAPTSIAVLEDKWRAINRQAKTDILYVGKGDNVRRRIRDLLRFGVGIAENHKGGEWLWQISNISETILRIINCPQGKQKPFEKWVLATFYTQHGNWPLANRQGGQGNVVWHP